MLHVHPSPLASVRFLPLFVWGLSPEIPIFQPHGHLPTAGTLAGHRAPLAPWRPGSGAHVCAAASHGTVPGGRKSQGLGMAPAGVQEGVPGEVVARAGGSCPAGWGCQPAAPRGARPVVLPGWTPPPAHQPIRHWQPFEIEAAGLSRQLFL